MSTCLRQYRSNGGGCPVYAGIFEGAIHVTPIAVGDFGDFEDSEDGFRPRRRQCTTRAGRMSACKPDTECLRSFECKRRAVSALRRCVIYGPPGCWFHEHTACLKFATPDFICCNVAASALPHRKSAACVGHRIWPHSCTVVPSYGMKVLPCNCWTCCGGSRL